MPISPPGNTLIQARHVTAVHAGYCSEPTLMDMNTRRIWSREYCYPDEVEWCKAALQKTAQHNKQHRLVKVTQWSNAAQLEPLSCRYTDCIYHYSHYLVWKTQELLLQSPSPSLQQGLSLGLNYTGFSVKSDLTLLILYGVISMEFIMLMWCLYSEEQVCILSVFNSHLATSNPRSPDSVLDWPRLEYTHMLSCEK